MDPRFFQGPPVYSVNTRTNTNTSLDLPRKVIKPRRKLFFQHSRIHGSDYIQLPPPCRTILPGLQEWIAPRPDFLFGPHRPASCSQLLNMDKEGDSKWCHTRQASSGRYISNHRYSPYVSQNRSRHATGHIRPSATEERYGQVRESEYDDLSDDSRQDQPDEEERRLWESWHYHHSTMEWRTAESDGIPSTGTRHKPLGRDFGCAFDPPVERHGRPQMDARRPGGPTLRPAAWHDSQSTVMNSQHRRLNTQGYLQ